MKKLSLLFLAAVLSLNVFADGNESGNTRANAISYTTEGIKASSEANVGKWYVVDLVNTLGFSTTTGKTAGGQTEANIVIANPLDETAHVDITAYIGDNETSRSFTLLAHEQKTMNVGAGMLVRMGITKVYLYIVMDVEIPQTVAEDNKIQVNVQPAESNSVAFIPVDFNWAGFGDNTEAAGNDIAANKETWIKIDIQNNLQLGKTFKVIVKNLGAATTIYGGLATDCPATNIQEQEKAVAANGTMEKTLDQAMIDMLPGVIYIRVKAGQALHVTAMQVPPVLPAQPLFMVSDANTVVKNDPKTLASDSVVYKVDYNTLVAKGDEVDPEDDKYYVVKVEVKNNGGSAVELVGKVTKTYYDGDPVQAGLTIGGVYSAVKKSVTIQPGQTLTKEIDKTLMANLEAGDEVYALILGGNSDVEFKLVEVCTEENPCVPAEAIEMVIPATGEVSKQQSANDTTWYKVNIAAAKTASADIELTMTAAEAATLTVDVAADCKLGEPTQTYTGTSATTTKTLSYSLIKGVTGDYVYVRVETNKAISVTAKLISLVKYTSTGWSETPVIEKAARIEADLTITDTIRALGVTLAGGNITIADGGILIVGAEGIKGSETVDQIVVENGGQLFISSAASTNNKPFVTVKKALEFGAADATLGTPRRAEKHEFVALPVDNREAAVGIRYYGWNYATGWVTNGFNKTFTGYDIFQLAGDANFGNFTASFKGLLADNKSQSLNIAGAGWHAFGNSWLAPLNVTDIINGISGAEAAVHIYVKTPAIINTAEYGLENSEKLYIPVTAAMVNDVPEITTLGLNKIAPMQGFFIHAEGTGSVNLNYNNLFSSTTHTNAAPARRVANNRTIAAAVLRGGNQSDFVFMIEDEDANVHKMQSNGLSIYAEDGLAQVANDNLIGTVLTIKTNDATEYTLSFTWLKGETLYVKDLENGNVIAMTAENTYTFNAAPNTVSERFQIVGRYDAPTGIENTVIEGANKFIENGKIVIIKNGVKYDVLGAQL